MLAISFVLTIATANGQSIALFWNLYEAVAQGSRIIHDVTEGVGAVSKAIQAIDSFLDISAEQQIKDTLDEKSAEDADPTAGNTEKTEAPKDPPAAAEVPKFNGCGALGFHIRDDNLPIEKLTTCCGQHDDCYSASCRANKRECDYKLRSCLFSVCDDKSLDRAQVKSCKGASKLLFSGTMVLSNQQYAEDQKQLNCPK